MYLVSRLLRPFTLASLAVLTVPTFAAADGISFGAGGFAMIAPAYEGSDEYRVRGIPVVFPVFGDGSAERSRINVRGLDDVRLSVLRRGGFDIGPIVGYSFGRDEDLSDKLDGLGDVDGGLVLGAFTSYTAGAFFAETGFSTQVTGGDDNGYVADVRFGYTADIAPRISLTAGTGLEYASDAYMDRYFSVTTAQSNNSGEGYDEFDAAGGIKNVSADLTLEFQATDRVTLRANGGYSRLVGDAANSPISESNNQLSGGLGLLIRF